MRLLVAFAPHVFPAPRHDTLIKSKDPIRDASSRQAYLLQLSSYKARSLITLDPVKGPGPSRLLAGNTL